MSAGLGHNGMTREEWLYAILQSGSVTRIAQHLALVIYHLADPATHRAKLSARDLERITGWGRTAIIEHIDELDIFIRVTWGAGRAKALFELQGVIAEALEPLRNGRQPATSAAKTDHRVNGHNGYVRQPDTMVDTTADTSVVATEADTTADTTADTKSYGQPDGHKNDVHNIVVSASRTQNPNLGGVRGGTNLDSSIQTKDSLSQGIAREAVADATPPPFVIHPDGSMNLTAFEYFAASEIISMRQAYSFLEFPAELIAADQYLAAEFERDGTEFGSQERFGRLHTYLNKRNRDASTALKAAIEVQKSKARAQSEDDSCWFDGDRLMVANGFREDLLALVGGDEKRLRTTLDKAAIGVGIDMKGAVLRKAVRGHFTRAADWDGRDERKTEAVVKRVGGTTISADGKVETQSERLARMAAEIERNKGMGARQ